jgi:hypothetical protein
MTKIKAVVAVGKIQQRILLIRGEKVIIDSDLADFYGVPTRRLNEHLCTILFCDSVNDHVVCDNSFNASPDELEGPFHLGWNCLLCFFLSIAWPTAPSERISASSG